MISNNNTFCYFIHYYISAVEINYYATLLKGETNLQQPGYIVYLKCIWILHM